jgi:hypothetical protein
MTGLEIFMGAIIVAGVLGFGTFLVAIVKGFS